MLCCAPLLDVSSTIADGLAGCTDSPMDGPTIGFQHKAHGIVVKISSKLLHNNNCMVQFVFLFFFLLLYLHCVYSSFYNSMLLSNNSFVCQLFLCWLRLSVLLKQMCSRVVQVHENYVMFTRTNYDNLATEFMSRTMYEKSICNTRES
jgi:hypothetical protein